MISTNNNTDARPVRRDSSVIKKRDLYIIVAIACVVISGALLGMMAIISPSKTELVVQRRSEALIAKERQLKELEISYLAFQAMHWLDVHDMFLRNLHDKRYKLGGNARNNEFDCSGAIEWVLRLLGANLSPMRTADFYKALQASKAPLRQSLWSVKSKDIIVMKVKGQDHLAWVERIKNRSIYYMDMNITGMSHGQAIKFGDKRIVAIYGINFDFWIGDLFKKN